MSATPAPVLGVRRIPPQSLPSLSACLDEGRLRHDGLPLGYSAFDVEALRLAEWSRAEQASLVVIPPDPLAPIAPMMAAAVHVADMTERYRTSRVYAGSRLRVVVVSRDYHVRGTYRGLGVTAGNGSGSALLRAVVPAATLGLDGRLHFLRSAAGAPDGWSTLFVESVEQARRLRGVDLVIVDLPADEQRRILEFKAPTIVIARDPAEPIVQSLAEQLPVFAWSEADIREFGEGERLSDRLAMIAEGLEYQIVDVPNQAVCENAALFWQDIGPLLDLAAKSSLGRDLAREAFGLFHDLMGLALPTTIYEAAVAPLNLRLRALADAARFTAGDLRETYFPMVTAELTGLVQAIARASAKAEMLRRTVEDALDTGADVLLVCRTAQLARVYDEYFRAYPGLARLRITSLGAISDARPADVAVLTGMAPSWARWIYRAGLGKQTRVLAYSPEGPVESVAAGFNEVGLVQNVLSQQKELQAWLGRKAVRARSWQMLRTHTSVGPRLVLPPHKVASVADTVKAQPADVPPGLWERTEWLRSAEKSPSGHDPDQTQPEAGPVEAVRVTFEDGRWALLAAAGTVNRLKPASGDTEVGYLVARLKPGDRVLFIDGTAQKTLLTKVLEVSEQVPELAVASAWVSHWRHVLTQAYRRFGTYSALARAMAKHGCAVQDQTIRLWAIGVTIGPEDPRDVQRLGAVMGESALISNSGEINKAIRVLRSASIKLARRVAGLAMHIGPAAAAGKLALDEVIDERSGLTAADFQASIDIATVKGVAPAGTVPGVLTGRVHYQHEV